MYLPKINVDNHTLLFVDKDVFTVSIANSENMANNATNCNGTSVPHLRSMPLLQVVAKPLSEEETENWRVSFAYLIKASPSLVFT